MKKQKKTVSDEIRSQKKKGKPQDQAVAIALSKKERGEIKKEETSVAGVEGYPVAGKKKKRKAPSIIREEDPTIDEILDYLLNDLGVITNAS